MQIKHLKVKGKNVQGFEVRLQNAALVLARVQKGYIMCGYLDIKTAEKLGDCAAIVRGVKDVEGLLTWNVTEMTTAARKAGVKAGIKGLAALSKML